MKISIDKSALNNILNDECKSNRLHKVLVEKDIILIVPFETFTEAVAGSRVDFIHQRLARLHRILDAVGVQRLIISRSAAEWIKREFKGHGQLKNIPCLANSPRWTGLTSILCDLEKLREFHVKGEDERTRQKQIKEKLKKSDCLFRKVASTRRFSDEDLRTKISNFQIINLPSDVSAFFPAFEFAASKTKIRKAIRAEKGFTHLKCYLSLMLLRALGNSISQYAQVDPLAFFDGIKKGNWFDLGCIAISSQLDQIVTDDNDQFAFAKLAYERGLIKASPLRSGDFLGL
ncbi:MAG: hypothetical protein IPM97_01315 [Bdellovibrionaceae bacterium]|nr:hypothetical protein [Pseudobdellovibrionaceae bacterium]